MLVLMMRACDPVVAATTFTLMTSAHATGMSIGGGLVGTLEAAGGFQTILLFAGAMIALSGLSALLLTKKTGGALEKPPVRVGEPDSLGLPVV